MSDDNTPLAELRQLMAAFVVQRDWGQFHTPKNLAMSLAIEAAELMEHFQWLTPEQSRSLADKPDKLAEVGEELADVLCYALALANELQLDLTTCIRLKMVKNAEKYPADQFRGKYGVDDVNECT
jgi:dCTP diphosphatase